MNKIFVIGSGAWGTALSYVASYNAKEVIIYTRNHLTCDSINLDHQNINCFQNIILPSNIRSSLSLSDLIGCDLILLAIPTQQIRSIIKEILNTISHFQIPILICSKGIENGSNKFLSEVITELNHQIDLAILSGPNFASEVIEGRPAFATIASENMHFLSELESLLTTKSFFVEKSIDIMGVQLCGAIKNIYAIAAGIGYGLKLGDNFHAALIKKMIVEMQYILKNIGGNPDTINTYAGIGDLVLTCSSMQSRNARLGVAIAENQDIESFLSSNTAEGYYTAESIYQMFSHQKFYKKSILAFVYTAVKKGIHPVDIVELLNQ